MTLQSRRPPTWLVLALVGVAAALAGIGWRLVTAQQDWRLGVARRAAQQAATARAAGIARWHETRLAEADALRANERIRALAASIASASATRDDVERWDQLVAVLLAGRRYDAARLLGPDATVRHATGGDLAQGYLGVVADTTRRSQGPALLGPLDGGVTDASAALYVPLCPPDAIPDRDTPILLLGMSDPDSGPLGAMGGRLAATSTEVLLVQISGGRLQPFLAIGTRAAVTSPAALQALGVLEAERLVRSGSPGVFAGHDREGHAVVGAVAHAAQTSWWVITAIRVDAVKEEAREDARHTAVLLALVALVAGSVLLLIWQQRRAVAFRQLYEAEAQRRELERSQQQIFDAASDAIFIAGESTGTILDANRRATELTGRPLEQLRGLHHRALHPPDLEEQVTRDFREHAAMARPDARLTWVQHAGGQRIPVEISTSHIEFGGEPALLGIFHDVTEREMAAEALRLSEEGYRVAAEQTGQLIYDHSFATGRTVWRGAIDSLTGFARDEYARFDHARWIDEIHPDDRAAVTAVRERAIAGGGRFTADYRLRRKDGTWFVAEDHGVCMRDGHGAITRMIGTIRDVTRHRAAEEELRSSEARRQKIESLAILAGGIAHDFNNLLTSILGNISLARYDLPHDSEATRCLGDAERASLRAKDLTRQLLTFSKGGVPVKKTMDLRPLTAEAVSFASRGTPVRVALACGPEPLFAEVDEGQLTQVVNNIALNAVQAMPAGGVLSVVGDTTHLDEENTWRLEAGAYVRLTFSDTGIGMPPEIVDRVFDPYFTTKQQGSGLGLAICHSIVLRHEGHIAVRSTPGAGTTFEILLPAAQNPAAAARVDTAAPMPRSARVLVMDDEEQVRDLVVRMLGRLGHRVTGVATGEEALQAYQDAQDESRPFDLVIMDLTIVGGLGGKETVVALKARYPRALVVASSGYSNDPVIADPVLFGFDGVLAKPYQLADVKALLAQLVT